MAATRNLFDLELYDEKLSNCAQYSQGARDYLRSNAVTGQRYDLV
jgi:hypothetical protein